MRIAAKPVQGRDNDPSDLSPAHVTHHRPEPRPIRVLATGRVPVPHHPLALAFFPGFQSGFLGCVILFVDGADTHVDCDGHVGTPWIADTLNNSSRYTHRGQHPSRKTT